MDRAMADYDRAIGFDPSFALAYYNRGTAWRNRNKRDRALADLNVSIRLDPNYAPASVIAPGSTATRAMWIAEALRLNPAGSRDYYARGKLYFDKHDYEFALADFNAAIEHDPAYAHLQSELSDQGHPQPRRCGAL